MTPFQRAVAIWFNVFVFVILLVLRLDQRIQWNWFIVFIPMWLYDSILLIYEVFKMISFCKTGRIKKLLGEAWYMAAVFVKLSAQILICLRLEATYWYLPARVFLVPFWLLLPALAIDVFIRLMKIH